MYQLQKSLFASLLITDPADGSLLGFYKFQNCMAVPEISSIKDGADGTFTLDMTIQKNPIMLTPE